MAQTALTTPPGRKAEPLELADMQGLVARAYGHLPFGELWYSTGTVDKWKFTSYERDTDTNLGLADRAAVANKASADAFVSIHLNDDDNPTVQGTETWVHTKASAAIVITAQIPQTVHATRRRDGLAISDARHIVALRTRKVVEGKLEYVNATEAVLANRSAPIARPLILYIAVLDVRHEDRSQTPDSAL